MKIIVLDGHTLNPGDLSWAALEELGDVKLYDRTPPEETVGRAADAQIVVTNKAAISRETVERLARLRYIGVSATGYNMVDVEAARRRNVAVANVPTYGTGSVAQMVFAHLLNFTQHVSDHARSVRHGRWSGSEDFCYWDHPLVELAGLTLGIVGLGRIGRATAQIGLAFGMRVLASDIRRVSPPAGAELSDLETLFRQSDVISLHCPLRPETQELINKDRLALMKPSAVLINTSRGPLVDEQALAEELNSGGIAGAGLDVLSTEPPEADNPLLRARNCFITPHIAWATKAARQRLLAAVVENVRAFLDGRPQNVVNP